MITVKDPDFRSLCCGSCGSATKVLAIRVTRDANNSHRTIHLCDKCRKVLIRKLAKELQN